MEFKVGDLVWTIGVYEHLYYPYRIRSLCESEGQTFAEIQPERYPGDVKKNTERMNVVYLSHSHPLGWKFNGK